MTDDQIKHMVDRFLGWRLPENFTPDAGISFERTYNEHTPYPMKHEPVGTNLFDAQQAEQMVRYMVDGMPPADWSAAAREIGKAFDIAIGRDESGLSDKYIEAIIRKHAQSQPSAPEQSSAVQVAHSKSEYKRLSALGVDVLPPSPVPSQEPAEWGTVWKILVGNGVGVKARREIQSLWEAHPGIVPGWQPIETAPKDGTTILVCGGVYYSDGAGYSMNEDEYSIERARTGRWYDNGWWLGFGSMYNEEIWAKPTHWMPLPAAPKAVKP